MRTRFIRGAGVAIALMAGTGIANLAVTAAPAGAATHVSVTYNDACTYNVAGITSGSGSFPVTVSATAPASVAPGGKPVLGAVQFSVTVSAALIQEAVKYGATNIIAPSSISKLDIAATDTTSTTKNVNVTKKAFTIPSVALAKYEKTGYTIKVPKAATKESGWVAGKTAGTMTFYPGAVALKVTFKDSIIGSATATVACKAMPSTTVIATTTVS
jgi:hypothetical protein